MHFLVTLAIALTSTGLVSRLLFMVLASWGGESKYWVVHIWSFCLCGLLFVIWCTLPGDPWDWFAAHKVFLPQAAWLIYDILRSGRHEPQEEIEAHRSENGG